MEAREERRKTWCRIEAAGRGGGSGRPRVPSMDFAITPNLACEDAADKPHAPIAATAAPE